MRELLQVMCPHQELNMCADDMFYLPDDKLDSQLVYRTYFLSFSFISIPKLKVLQVVFDTNLFLSFSANVLLCC